MMLLICTMSVVFRLLSTVPAAYGNDRRDPNQEDPEPVTYYVPVISAGLPSRRLVNNGSTTSNSVRRRRSDVGNLTGGHCNAVFGSPNADSAADVCVPISATSTFQGVDLSEDYHQYSYSDDVRLPTNRSSTWSVTKTIRRWRTRGAAVVSPLLTERSSAEPLLEVQRGVVAPTLSARRGWLQQLSLGSIVITKPEEDRLYTMTDATPWTPLLSLCTEPNPIEFQQIIPNNSQVAAVSCNDSDGDLFCLGTCPAEERLVRVLRLRQQDVHWHTTRLTLARELCGLKDKAQNRTSAFFLDARTSLVHDRYPKLLWDARRSLREGPVAGDATPPEVAVFGVYGAFRGRSPEIRHTPRAQFPGPAQAVSILEQACWALAVAESALEFEHRLPVLGAVLVRPTRSPRLEFTLRGRLERISSAGYKIRLQGLQMARMTIDASPQCTELSRHREFILGEEESHCVRQDGFLAEASRHLFDCLAVDVEMA
ncbi:hypothetical protein HPB49_015023 [Dermacentor silvarum]|uniref:Uncharacterized protein n=1 Tax=Dermacentor silvarum TaxID=543639 RepID=A0ACB8E149_DERSI|nr:hypothetical protein HPB49_015023 [Dermacentor silvarum]